MPKYRAFIEMTFEPDEHGYLEWEDEYGLTLAEIVEECESKPRTQEEMKEFFANELYEYVSDYRMNIFDAIYVEKVTE